VPQTLQERAPSGSSLPHSGQNTCVSFGVGGAQDVDKRVYNASGWRVNTHVGYG